MKLFERRLRASSVTLAIITLPFAVLAFTAIATGELFIPRGRIGTAQTISRTADPEGFSLFLCFYVLVAAVAAFFSFYRFRRGSWFNPI